MVTRRGSVVALGVRGTIWKMCMRLRRVNRCLIGLALMPFLAGPATAADTPKVDVAIGYSILRELDADVDQTSPLGWVAAAAGNINDSFAILGEVGGNYKSFDAGGMDVDVKVHTFVAGARFANRRSARASPFAQVLVGAGRATGTVLGISRSTTGFAIQPGGGVDIAVGPNVAIRLQGDYRALRDEGETFGEVRFGVGAVFGFGRR